MIEPKMDEFTDPTVARMLQAELNIINEHQPPAHNVPFFLNSYRHACEAARTAHSAGKGVSTNIDTPEQYLEAGDGIHALVYREGKCKKCGALARSSRGRAVLMAERPPLVNRVARD